MRRLLILIAALMAVWFSNAQSLDAFKERLASPVVWDAASNGLARVMVAEHGDAAAIVRRAAQANSRLRVRGYRVCIFFDNGQNARSGAAAARTLFETTYPGTKIYTVYDNPYFKISVGNCLTAEEAIILKGRVSGLFPKAFLKNEEFSIADLLN